MDATGVAGLWFRHLAPIEQLIRVVFSFLDDCSHFRVAMYVRLRFGLRYAEAFIGSGLVLRILSALSETSEGKGKVKRDCIKLTQIPQSLQSVLVEFLVG